MRYWRQAQAAVAWPAAPFPAGVGHRRRAAAGSVRQRPANGLDPDGLIMTGWRADHDSGLARAETATGLAMARAERDAGQQIHARPTGPCCCPGGGSWPGTRPLMRGVPLALAAFAAEELPMVRLRCRVWCRRRL